MKTNRYDAPPSAADSIEIQQNIKDCYCGLGTDCTHWDEMTPEGRAACSQDKRAAVDAMWKNGMTT